MTAAQFEQVDEKIYRRRVWAWTMYDWANSAFATTILAAVLPIYFSQVAGATLPSAAVATSYWSLGLSLSLFFIAILSPILGTISDIMRGKKRFLAFFAGIGIISTALLVLVDTGDWILASTFGIVGRIGFSGANSFYDALLPHVARPGDRDRISSLGYAMGYLGGGLLLAVNIVMIQLLPGTWGARLSFLSVAIWWAVFSIPIFRYVPEPPAATARLARSGELISISFRRLWGTVKDMQQYRELFKFLVAFFIYNDGIGTIIGVAAIYGAELGFGSTELILALLLVQFVGIPYSLIFGRLPSPGDRRRPFYLAFVLFNLFALPLVGWSVARLLPATLSGARPSPFMNTASAQGEGVYTTLHPALDFSGGWEYLTAPGRALGSDQDVLYASTLQIGASYRLVFNGQKVRILYNQGPDYGKWALELDGQPVLDEDSSAPLVIDAYNPTVRYDISRTIQAETEGEHSLVVVNTSQRNSKSQANRMTLTSLEVLPGIRRSNLMVVIGMIFGLEALGLGFAWLVKNFFTSLVEKITTQRGVLLALAIYTVIAIWGFFLDSVVEFWFLAWMVAVVQGGSQALSRSLYAGMSPAAKSGEFFGLFGIMEKFSAIIGPLLFALAGSLFGSSRPAVLSLIVLFAVGGFLLRRVNVQAGQSAAQAEDQRLLRK